MSDWTVENVRKLAREGQEKIEAMSLDKELRERLSDWLDGYLCRVPGYAEAGPIDCNDLVIRIEAELSAAGYAVVREEPSERMIIRGMSVFYVPVDEDAWEASREIVRRGWSVMLAAAKEGGS